MSSDTFVLAETPEVDAMLHVMAWYSIPGNVERLNTKLRSDFATVLCLVMAETAKIELERLGNFNKKENE